MQQNRHETGLLQSAPNAYQAVMRWICVLFLIVMTSPAAAATLACGGVVAPGLAYPDVNGAWHGKELDLCQAIAAKRHETVVFTPILQDSDVPPPGTGQSVVFLPAELIGAGYTKGAEIFNDHQALMVPAGSPARTARDLAGADICVEPGSPEDFGLIAYFKTHHIALQEFPFQETDEMHDAYVAGRCEAITARISLLEGLRANEDGARQHDILLPDNLGDNPIRAATPAGQPGWAHFVNKILQEQDHVNSQGS